MEFPRHEINLKFIKVGFIYHMWKKSNCSLQPLLFAVLIKYDYLPIQFLKSSKYPV